MRRAQRKAGAPQPAPSTAAISPRGIESSSGRRTGFRRLLALLLGAPGLCAGASGLVVAAAPAGLALGLGALGLLAAAPAQAQQAVPQNVKVIQGDGKLTLTWQAPTTWTGGANHFEIQWKLSSGTAWANVWKDGFPVQLSPNVTSFEFTGSQQDGNGNSHTVSNEIDYDLRIYAASSVNSVIHVSAWVTVSNQVPANLLLNSLGEGRLSVSWRQLPGVTGYEVQYTSANAATAPDDATAVGSNPSTGWVAVARHNDVNTGLPSIEPGQFIGGLVAGREYRVRVRGKGAGGLTSLWAVARTTVRSRHMSRIPWAATLTVKYVGTVPLGCDTSLTPSQRCNNPAVLTDDDATDVLGSKIEMISLESGTLALHAAAAFLEWPRVNTLAANAFPASYPKLCVDGTAFAFTDDRLFEADSVKRRALWSGSGLSWSADDQVGLSIITSGSCPSSYAELIQLIAH